MQDDQILVIIDYASSLERKLSNDVDIRLGLSWSIEPAAAQMDRLDGLFAIRLNDKDLEPLYKKVYQSQLAIEGTYLFESRSSPRIDIFSV